MKIIFTYSFNKKLLQLGNITEKDIINLIKKYPNTNNLIIIDSIETSKIIKGYLYSKKIRILILFEYKKGKFIPVLIVKKESSKGKNIIKNNYIELFGNDIDKVINDYDNNNFSTLSLTHQVFLKNLRLDCLLGSIVKHFTYIKYILKFKLKFY